jgi:hypothetical protein
MELNPYPLLRSRVSCPDLTSMQSQGGENKCLDFSQDMYPLSFLFFFEVDFFNLPNPSSRTMALGSTHPLTEMSTRNLPGGKGWPAGA